MGINRCSSLSRSGIASICVALTFSIAIMGCGGSGSSSEETLSESYSYQIPLSINDGWQVDHLSNQNVDEVLITQLMNNIENDVDQFRYINAVLIAKNGRLVLNEQFKNELDFTDQWANNQDLDLHILNSVSKSFASTLIGIAIDQQVISSTDLLVHDYFPHKQPIANWSDAKANITLQNWLTMRHGYQWDEWNVSYFDPENQNALMNNASDPMQFLLDQPLAEQPGSVFAYSTGVSFALGRLVERASGESLTNYMEEHLFDPLSITSYTYWSLDNTPHMGSALYLSTRDMAKLGQLFLDGGVWNGNQVISESWIEQATVKRVDNDTWGYGYQWWMTEFSVGETVYETYYADGLGGQHIFVFPALNAVVAFNGDAYEDNERDQRSYRMILEDYILPSLIE